MHKLAWYIGCSGFYYKEWKDVFYPKGLTPKEWFPFYCRHFNTLEINNTFYRFPEIKNLESWYNRSPENFVFSVKVPRAITHLQKFSDTESLLNDFYGVVRKGFQEKLGPVLFQLPPKLGYSKDMLNRIISQVDESFTNVIEFRNASWWQPEVFETLNRHNITFCGVSFPNLDDKVISNTAVCYYRFHGTPKLYYSDYSADFLTHVVESIRTNSSISKAFLYFNNTASTAALHNAGFVQQLVQ